MDHVLDYEVGVCLHASISSTALHGLSDSFQLTSVVTKRIVDWLVHLSILNIDYLAVIADDLEAALSCQAVDAEHPVATPLQTNFAQK